MTYGVNVDIVSHGILVAKRTRNICSDVSTSADKEHADRLISGQVKLIDSIDHNLRRNSCFGVRNPRLSMKKTMPT